MTQGIEGLLLNVLFIIVFLLFIPLLLEINLKFFQNKNKRWVITVSAGLGIISCLTFPFSSLEGFIYDLRWVAVIIGGLYGGIPTSIILIGIVIIYRSMIGGVGVATAIIVAISILIILIPLTKVFYRSSRKKKLMIGGIFSFLATLGASFVSMVIYGSPMSTFLVTIYLFLSQNNFHE